MMAENPLYLAWLNEAYAMEKEVAEILERHAKQAEGHPNIQSKILEHMYLTHSQRERVKACLERNGGHISTLKEMVADLIDGVIGMGSGTAKDRLLKNAIAEYAIEHYEIASYKALMTAAEALNDQETARVCRDILLEEQEMAGWLDQNLPVDTHLALAFPMD